MSETEYSRETSVQKSVYTKPVVEKLLLTAKNADLTEFAKGQRFAKTAALEAHFSRFAYRFRTLPAVKNQYFCHFLLVLIGFRASNEFAITKWYDIFA